MPALILGVALAIAAHPVTLTLDVGAPVESAALRQALIERGLQVVNDGSQAAWHVRLRQAQDQGRTTWIVRVHRWSAAVSSIRILADHGLPQDVLVRNLALLIAEHTTSAVSPERADGTEGASGMRPAATRAPVAHRARLPQRRAGTPAQRARQFSLRFDTEAAAPMSWDRHVVGDVLRLGFLVGAGLQVRRWVVDLGVGYLESLALRSGALWGPALGATPTVLRSVSPGRAFLARLGLGYRLWTRSRWALALGIAAEIDVNRPVPVVDNGFGRADARVVPNLLPWAELRWLRPRLSPVLRIGWRQPIRTTNVSVLLPSESAEPIEVEHKRIAGALAISLGVSWGL